MHYAKLQHFSTNNVKTYYTIVLKTFLHAHSSYDLHDGLTNEFSFSVGVLMPTWVQSMRPIQLGNPAN